MTSNAVPVDGARERVTAGPPVIKTLTLETTQPGWIKAFEETPLFPRVAGYIESVQVDIGDRVEQGQTLITLFAPELQDEVHQFDALVKQAEAEIQQARAGQTAAQAAEKTARARLKGMEAGILRAAGEHDRWTAEHARLRELAGRGTVTDKLVDETLNQLRSAEAAKAESLAAVDTAQAAVEEAAARVQTAAADLAAAQARLKVAQANRARAHTMLAYLRIAAPYRGVITQRNVDTQHLAQPPASSSRPLLVIARDDVVRVFTDIPEAEAELVSWEAEAADPATVIVPALGNRTFTANVTRTSWSLDPANRSLRTEVDIPNESGRLRPGMYATVRIRLEERPQALTLPATAIVRQDATAYCCVVADGRVEHRPVKLGLRSGDDIEILSGVSPEDLVVLARAAGLLPGQLVDLVDGH